MSPADARRSSEISSILLFLLFSSALSSALTCQAPDREALQKIKAAFGSEGIFESWTHVTECCKLPGVFCDPGFGRVVSLHITGRASLSGHLPDAIADLSALTSLKISGHSRLSGPIPQSLGRLSSLQVLDLSKNRLSGPIPDSLSQLTKLFYINLSNNRLSGPIPDFFGSISEPDPFLDLSNNLLSGELPQTLGDPKWRTINLSKNRFTGDASMLFVGSRTVSDILLQGNNLAFDLSQIFFPPNLQRLDLSHNKITGTIPDNIKKIHLKILNLSYNQLCGQIPELPANIGPEAFVGNKCLCGSPMALCP